MIVAAAQLRLRIGDLVGNRFSARRAIEDAAVAGARLIVLPELTASGYVFADQAEAITLSEDLTGPTVTEWAELAAAHDLVIVGGVAERAAGGSTPRSSSIPPGCVPATARPTCGIGRRKCSSRETPGQCSSTPLSDASP